MNARYRGALLFIGVAFLSLVAEGRSADWPQFRGPGGLGVSTEKGLPLTWGPRENILWKVALPGPGSSPVVVGERIFLTSSSTDANQPERQLLCLARGNGKVVWSKSVMSRLPEQARIRENHGFASSTPVVDAGRIYAFFGKAGVVAFGQDGFQHWKADVGTGLSDWGSAASPVLFGKLVIVNASVESSSLVALDRATGKEVWRAPRIRESWSTPLLVPVKGGKTELVVSVMDRVLGFDPSSGEQLWSCDSGIRSYMVPSLVAHDGIVYCIGGRTNGSVAVRAGGRGDVTRTHRLWTSTKGSNVSSPIYHAGHLYWMHDGLGIAYCAEGATGRIVYEERVPRAGQFYASPVLVEGRIYQVNRMGRTFVLAASPRYELLASNDVGERSTFNAGLVVAGGRLYLRSERTLYCIGTK